METQREGAAVALLVFQSRTGLNERELHQEVSACVLPSSFLESSFHFSFGVPACQRTPALALGQNSLLESPAASRACFRFCITSHSACPRHRISYLGNSAPEIWGTHGSFQHLRKTMNFLLGT